MEVKHPDAPVPTVDNTLFTRVYYAIYQHQAYLDLCCFNLHGWKKQLQMIQPDLEV